VTYNTYMENLTYTPPSLGDIKCYVRQSNGGWTVQVMEFKHNTLRGDSYWVTEGFRQFKREADARRFAARYA
jgi:hypothetical protein